MVGDMDIEFHVLETITDKFSDEHKVGSGGYGDVYKGWYNGKEIAVKRLRTLQGLDDKALFDSEFRNLNKVKHENVVQLLGYCYQIVKKYVLYKDELVMDMEMERILCFEYMEGGSLDKHIEDESCRLDWHTCYQIIKGTCDGLHHLHGANEKPIFHLDLKPSNILLDMNNTMAKIADLGLSRLVASTETHQTQRVNIKGTLGYMPPEYVDGGYITRRYDVYSLGVIILKIMAGNKGHYRSYEMSTEQFTNHVIENWERKTQVTSGYSSRGKDILQVKKCIEIALKCVEKDRHKRPLIKDIVHELEELEAKIKEMSLYSDKVVESWSNMLDESQRGAQHEQVRVCAEIGLECTNFNPAKRPDTQHIISRLIETESMDGYMKMGGVTSQQSGSMPLHYLKYITNNFSDERELGKGGFGVVYKGLLQNGEMVAVKKISQAIPSSQTQFENEVNLLMKLKHRNIVRLIGYCYETRHLHMPYKGKYIFAGNTESFLCLECLPNGSLEKYISDASSGLNWITRCKVIEGISCGMQYLHEHSKEPIIHLDLKPANILLDANMLPKITDFGLSRLFDQDQTIYTAIRGTFGYMPPEFLKGIITPMSDIFSLGVIIVEVITGHRDYPDDIGKHSGAFIELELQKWRNRLQKEPGYTSLETDCQKIERCIKIGLLCVNPDRTKRPTMKKIMDMLEGSENTYGIF